MINLNFFNLTRVGGWINLTNIKIFYELAINYKKKLIFSKLVLIMEDH